MPRYLSPWSPRKKPGPCGPVPTRQLGTRESTIHGRRVKRQAHVHCCLVWTPSYKYSVPGNEATGHSRHRPPSTGRRRATLWPSSRVAAVGCPRIRMRWDGDTSGIASLATPRDAHANFRPAGDCLIHCRTWTQDDQCARPYTSTWASTEPAQQLSSCFLPATIDFSPRMDSAIQGHSVAPCHRTTPWHGQ